MLFTAEDGTPDEGSPEIAGPELLGSGAPDDDDPAEEYDTLPEDEGAGTPELVVIGLIWEEEVGTVPPDELAGPLASPDDERLPVTDALDGGRPEDGPVEEDGIVIDMPESVELGVPGAVEFPVLLEDGRPEDGTPDDGRLDAGADERSPEDRDLSDLFL